MAVTLLLASIAAAALWWLQARDDLAEFRTFPHTFIRVEDMGYDDSKVVVWRGNVSPPPLLKLEDGSTAWPCWIHPEGAVVPRQGGKPLLIPLIGGERGMKSTPPLPPRHKPLTSDQIPILRKYQTDEGQVALDRFAGRPAAPGD